MKDLFSGNSQDYNADAWPATKATEAMARTHFQNLTGLELDYYGADAGDHTFKVDDIVFKVLEDPNDGYRSCLGTIDYTGEHNSIFFGTAIARVRIETYDSADEGAYAEREDDYEPRYGVCQGYRLVDVADGHVWLEFGTDNYDDYYPCFIFRHRPKATPLKVRMRDIIATEG
jgi:hypothetical protein